ncbi:MAG: ArsR family transcriptional regulator [Novosphingobium sp. 28-62-57]|uniref:ArsR/SmtB family transcription factor n=1 Tax=unclassified Novosphingobium TaxID=2644732 RepID=UPI000BCEC166|nr:MULTISPECIES: metalloregulator ArsR/SmtB family transcription factor [unclassified Novosphingobium]OYW50374.1 MAG: ArsR family transcriptional regulator [Novosphingobium sp. 12-62-10]OYZ11522.1 MAG: ArsR family transcriptional regulator [Novosphingobium sp. 28-62-57]OZA38691.1 MAG: ArsR family transcriptional regulator [Novosphingobium sp. 17-62-9]HQS68854.1 metalloregulator ArsR/SmtB family transcription factor [Novosphingobium sp.]
MAIHDAIRALDDPTRLRILRLLASMELAVGEVAQVLGQSQPRVSRHIKILCDSGLAERRKEGAWVFLRSGLAESSDNPLTAALARLLDVAEQQDAAFARRCAEDRQHLDAIRSARQTHALEWFSRHAEEWDELRSLHIADGPVEAALTEMLLSLAGKAGLGRLLDVGTGTGRIAELLAPHAAHVVAFDKSPDMLRIARARLQHLPAERVELAQGDFAQLPFPARSFDTVLFHQVLHYAQAPEAVLAGAARVTAPGGQIAIVDFAAHDREDLRQTHAHARLGFSDAQIEAMLRDSGFIPQQTRALAGHELVVKLWTATRREDSVAQLEPRQNRKAL